MGIESGPPICAVSVWVEQKRYVVVVLAVDGERDRHLGVERLVAHGAEVRSGVKDQPVAPRGRRRGQQASRSAVCVGDTGRQKLPARINLSLQTNSDLRSRTPTRRVEHVR